MVIPSLGVNWSQAFCLSSHECPLFWFSFEAFSWDLWHGGVYFIGQGNVPARGCFRVVSGELPTSVLVDLFRSEISATLNWASSNMSLNSCSDISWLFLCVWSALFFWISAVKPFLCCHHCHWSLNTMSKYCSGRLMSLTLSQFSLTCSAEIWPFTTVTQRSNLWFLLPQHKSPVSNLRWFQCNWPVFRSYWLFFSSGLSYIHNRVAKSVAVLIFVLLLLLLLLWTWMNHTLVFS